MKSFMRNFVVLLVLAPLFIACGASRQAGWDREVVSVSGDESATIAQADAAWAGREDKAQLEQAIEL